MNNRKAIKRVLKPVIEKKRRDRINQRLDELRTILLRNTSDMRLKNPKLEKAEILELTVDYIRRKANGKDSKGIYQSKIVLVSPYYFYLITIQENTQPLHNPIYSAGFRECISRLDNYIDSVDPSQRESFVQEMRDHLDTHSAFSQGRVQSPAFPLDLQPWGLTAEGPCFMSRGPNRKDSTVTGHQRASREATFPYINTSLPIYPNTFVLHHHHPATHTQHLSPPYPSPPYSLSPPPSPCYSSSLSPFTSTPPFLSLPCHFPFPSSPSQLSSDSLSSSCHNTSQAVGPLVPSHPPLVSSTPTPLRPFGPLPDAPIRTLRRSLFQIQPQTVWRPWS
uniref:BHLH domain-containing protein n=1 Tax=Esox lucius TaxID=8010 RepID=A0A3P8YTC5_ESOLU